MKKIIAVGLLCALTACGANEARPQLPPSDGPVEETVEHSIVGFGETLTLEIPSGVVDYTVSTPEVVTFHHVDYGDVTDSIGPGEPYEPMVRVRIDAVGVSGTVHLLPVLDGGLEVQYEESDGTLVNGADAHMSYEASYGGQATLLEEQPTELAAGQKTGGELYFESDDPNGKLHVSSYEIGGGRLLGTWTAR